MRSCRLEKRLVYLQLRSDCLCATPTSSFNSLVGGVRDVLIVDYTNAARDQAWVGQEAQTRHCVESFAHKIDKAITVGGMHVQKWMPPRKLGENRGPTRS